jgi:hypothetical protein
MGQKSKGLLNKAFKSTNTSSYDFGPGNSAEYELAFLQNTFSSI